MSTLESIVLPLVDCQTLVKKGIALDTAMVWAGEHEYDFEAQQFDGCHIALIAKSAVAHEHEVICPAPTLTELVNAVRDKVGNPLEERTVILTHDGHREVACCAGVRSARGKYEIAYNDTDLQALATLLMEVSK